MDEVLAQQPSAAPDVANRLRELETMVGELRASAATITERRKQLEEMDQRVLTLKSDFLRILADAQAVAHTPDGRLSGDCVALVVSHCNPAKLEHS